MKTDKDAAIPWTYRDWLLPWLQVALVLGFAAGSVSLAPMAGCLGVLVAIPFRRGPAIHRRWAGWAVVVVCSLWWAAASLGGAGSGYEEFLRIGGWALILLACLQILSLGRGGSSILVAWCVLGASLVFSSGHGWYGVALVGGQVVLVVETVRRRAALSETSLRVSGRWLAVLLFAGAMTGLFQGRSLARWMPSGARWTDSVKRIKGFSTISRLGSFGADYLDRRDGEVAIRVWSDSSPGLLKGMVHDVYAHGSWIANRSSVSRPAERMSMDFSQFCRGGVDDSRPAAWASASDDHTPVLFAPTGTGCVGVVADSLAVGASGIFRAPPEGVARGWTWYRTDFVDTVSAPTDLRVPKELAGLLDTVLERIGLDSMPMARTEIVERAMRDLETNFRYDLDVPIVSGEDPLRTFLRVRRGYCEYYATAMVLLLRRAGVPARYVTGFSEPESIGDGIWIYRQGGAHAWVEWKTQDEGWTVADPVPASSPLVKPRSSYREWTEFVATGWAYLVHSLRDGRWRERLEEWNQNPENAPSLRWAIVALALIAVGVGLVGWRRRRSNAPTESVWAQRLTRAESRLRRHGHVRSATETVGEFLARLPRDVDPVARGELESYQASRWRRGGN